MKWKQKDEWENLKKGIGCPMCADFPLEENKFSYLVTELDQSYVRLPKNQYYKGWTIVGLKKHASELFELDDKTLLGFWKDVSIVSKALDNIYNPTKIDYCIFGHHCPHIHCHLFVQSYDSDPSLALKPDEKEVLLNTKEYESMMSRLKQEIQKIKL
jgi:diadenosine tetraphosphate (Ap4A) HIT family hydrolase